ncbi:hypothetical protein BDZ45DRAFT_807744 [Acephala macrosclerotiorum]|nr:hypothetical protein BDZ45DRAFT_807744 [Acephala macrosclerotiorum]
MQALLHHLNSAFPAALSELDDYDRFGDGGTSSCFGIDDADDASAGLDQGVEFVAMALTLDEISVSTISTVSTVLKELDREDSSEPYLSDIFESLRKSRLTMHAIQYPLTQIMAKI